MSAQTLFVTGTDTGIGKTRIAVALLHGLRAAGFSAVGYKPVASGCERTPAGLRNDDALALQKASTPGWDYDAINPIALAAPIAPHIAATEEGVAIDRGVLDAGHARLANASDWVVVEGAGGWHVPLNEHTDFAHWVSGHRWPTLLVVGMRLGCVNHALLSARAIAGSTMLAGWIANTLPPRQPRLDDNIACLETLIAAPLRARVACDAPVDLALNPAPWVTRINLRE